MNDSYTEINDFHSPSKEELSALAGSLECGEPTPAPKARGKWRELTLDKRPASLRLSVALLVSFAFAFTFTLFGPYELYIQSERYLTFPFSDFALPMALVALGVFALLFAILSLLRGKLYNYAVSVVFAITITGYIQRNFLNIDHGALDGHAIEWTKFALQGVLNFVFWCLMLAAVLALLYFSRKGWTNTVRALSVFLIVVQTVALVSMFITDPPKKKPDDVISSDADIYNVTTGKNVIFFLLDRFDNVYADAVMDSNPQWEEDLKGFTYYHNFTGSYTRTMPSVTYLLTGVKCDYMIPYNDYFKEAWSSSKFLVDIRDAGYKRRIYTDQSYAVGDPGNLLGLADNFIENKQTTNRGKMLRYMLSLSAYVYSPELFKPYFVVYTGDLASVSTAERDDLSVYKVNDPAFWNGYRDEGLTVEDGAGMFTFYHLSGPHEPYLLDENGYKMDKSYEIKDLYRQTTGDMNMIFAYIAELKEKGLYDNTTIIISADHGRTGTMTALDDVRCLALFIKPAGADGTQPMKISQKQICQDNLRASIISYFGLDASAYGRTIESIGEDEDVTRYFYMQGSDEERRHRDVEIVTYEIKGDANKFENWKEVGRDPIRYPYYDAH